MCRSARLAFSTSERGSFCPVRISVLYRTPGFLGKFIFCDDDHLIHRKISPVDLMKNGQGDVEFEDALHRVFSRVDFYGCVILYADD